jgi:hypothetical protein
MEEPENQLEQRCMLASKGSDGRKRKKASVGLTSML